MLTIYLIFEIFLKDRYGHLNYLLAIVNFFSWIQGLSKLRTFRSTRIFIHLMKQIIYDMRSFTIILGGALLAISTSYVMLVHNSDTVNNGDEYEKSIWDLYYLFYADFRINV